MVMPVRKFDAGGGYRYGFNGKEKDNEVKGEGNQIAYEARMYDPRLGRLLSIDPLGKAYPWYSSYQFAGNDVIRCADLLGKQPESKTDAWDKGHTTSFISGASSYQIYDRTKHQIFDATGVYDPATGKTWIVADDGQQQGTYFYLVNDNKSTDRMKYKIQNGQAILYGGHFEKFETQNQKEAKQGAQIADAIGLTVFGIAAGISAIYAAPVAGERLKNTVVDYVSQVGGNLLTGKRGYEAFAGNINFTSLATSFINPGSSLSTLAFNNTVSSFASITAQDGYNGLGGGKDIFTASAQAFAGTVAGRLARGTDLKINQLTGRLTHVNFLSGGETTPLSTSLQSTIRNTNVLNITLGVVGGGSGNAVNNKIEENAQ